MDNENIIRVMVDDISDMPEVTMKSARSSIEDLLRAPGRKVLQIETETLADGITATFQNVIKALSKLPTKSGHFEVDEISFALSIESTGGVSLLSTASGTLGNSVGITFKLSVRKNK